MTIQEVIFNLGDVNDDATVFAKCIGEEFQANSPVVLIELSDDEKYLPTKQITGLKCPGYNYFIEVSLIKKFVGDLLATSPQMKLKDKVARLIDYVKYDA